MGQKKQPVRATQRTTPLRLPISETERRRTALQKNAGLDRPMAYLSVPRGVSSVGRRNSETFPPGILASEFLSSRAPSFCTSSAPRRPHKHTPTPTQTDSASNEGQL